MSEMVERAAKAAQEVARNMHSHFDDYVALEVARAVINEMREPTDAMLEAADGPWCDDDRPSLKHEYQAMIDAAMKPCA